jgi:uncharacterized iron-regulated protein
MPLKRLFPCLLLLLAALGACAMPASWQAPHYQDHKLVGKIWSTAKEKFVSQAELTDSLTAAHFILLGETHDNPDHHLLQAKLIMDVATSGRRPIVAFEMIDMTKEQSLAEHLSASPKDTDGIAEAIGWQQSGWPDWQLYRPVADAALQAGLTLRPANMNRAKARGLAQSGLTGADPSLVEALRLDKPLPDAEQANVRQEIDDAHCGYAPAAMIDAMVFAQFARDAHMARAMQNDSEEGGAILIAGAGHARRDRAVPFHLRRMAPGRHIISLAFLEVSDGEESPPAYAEPFGSLQLPFDYVWFTPRVDVRDACERFEEQLEKMQEGKPKASEVE